MEDFELETKMRKLISELSEPTIRRAAEVQQIVLNIEYNVSNHKRRFDEIEFAVNKQDKKFGILDEIYRRMSQNENEIKQIEGKIESASSKTMSFIESVKNDLVMTKERIESVASQQEQIKKESDKQWEKFIEYREKFHREYRTDVERLDNHLIKIDGQLSELQAK